MPEILYFRPLTGLFDEAQVSGYLAGLGYSFRDAIQAETFVVSHTAAGRDFGLERRRTAPERGFPPLLLILVRPGLITVDQQTRPEELLLAAQFMEWLTDHYDCTATDDYDHDLTEAYKRRPVPRG